MGILTALDRQYKSLRRNHFKQRFFEEYNDSLPEGLERACQWRFSDSMSREEQQVKQTIENRREELASLDEGIEIYYSPNPENVDDPSQPGEKTIFEPDQIAQTGVAAEYGIFLRRIIQDSSCSRILELGACAGISAAYMASGTTGRLETVEASGNLAPLARETIERVHDDFKVHNLLFEDYLDSLNNNDRFDLAALSS